MSLFLFWAIVDSLLMAYLVWLAIGMIVCLWLDNHYEDMTTAYGSGSFGSLNLWPWFARAVRRDKKRCAKQAKKKPEWRLNPGGNGHEEA